MYILFHVFLDYQNEHIISKSQNICLVLKKHQYKTFHNGKNVTSPLFSLLIILLITYYYLLNITLFCKLCNKCKMITAINNHARYTSCIVFMYIMLSGLGCTQNLQVHKR